jgi:hypothetical protein
VRGASNSLRGGSSCQIPSTGGLTNLSKDAYGIQDGKKSLSQADCKRQNSLTTADTEMNTTTLTKTTTTSNNGN